MSGVPYEMKPRSGLAVPSGQVGCFDLDFPGRALINKIIVLQVDGNPVAFTIALFNHEGVCAGLSAQDSDGAETGTLPPEIFRVTPDIDSTEPGRLVYFSEDSTGGNGFTFINQDGRNDPEARRSVPRKLYIQIRPHGPGDTKFAVAIGGYVYQ